MINNSTQTSYCEPIDGGLLPNVLQIPVVLAAVVIPAVIKRRCCENPLTRRTRKVWAFDVTRIACSSTISWLVLIIFSRGLATQADACSTLLVLASIDLTLGSLLDACVCWLMFLGHMRLGFYGEPPQHKAYAAQTLSWMLISVATRSAACCVGTLALGAASNENLNLRVYEPELFYYVTMALPFVYYVLRFAALDDVSAFRAGYERVQPPAQSQIKQNPMHVIGAADSSSDEDAIDATARGKDESSRGHTTPCELNRGPAASQTTATV